MQFTEEPVDATLPAPRIDIDDYYGIREWCDRFGVAKHRLRDAVAAVGSDPQAVQQYLLRSAPPPLTVPPKRERLTAS
ncbi:DUF3606 domain-containing protein [Aquabacterium sp. J223]|uniref:DUF3606 domain-containing protein n=1 Tax=Aquabacterium sp. J223 TaxID=2898431 RepID=UPI0021ADAB30|nr:DUF3606 domain-containing protein [Aquabacterium sp. J223]UUX93969.1 DUF3606 domain-containing protein [Aquabacterium sp. J223]